MGQNSPKTRICKNKSYTVSKSKYHPVLTKWKAADNHSPCLINASILRASTFPGVAH